jgi:hypothetical protein
MVHRIDLEQALGHRIFIETDIAGDAIDELFQNLPSAAHFSPRVRELRGLGELIAFRPDDYPGSWTVQLSEKGFSLVEASMTPHAQLSGRVRELLLVLYRRKSFDVQTVRVGGDRALVEFWVSNSALE